MYRIILLIVIVAMSAKLHAQKSDTVTIHASNVQTKVLQEGTHRYLVYFKMSSNAPRTMTQFWTRAIVREQSNGRDIITVTQSWEDKDSVMHTTKSICDAGTFAPLFHENWWKRSGKVSTSSFDFASRSAIVDGTILTKDDTAKNRKVAWDAFSKALDQYTLNWHLDLEVFPTLPFKKGVTFAIPFYDPGFSAPRPVYYSVTGEDNLIGYNGQKIECWLLEHSTGKGNREIFWIAKKTKEVLKLEQEIGGRMYRYKVKMAFSV